MEFGCEYFGMTERAGRGRPKGSKGKKRVLSAPKEKLRTALKEKLTVEPSTGCWLYDGKPTATGHATFYYGGAIQGSAHRVAYEVWVGPIPAGGYVMQTCENKLCCNPTHLKLAKFADVIKARDDAGKSIRGGRNPKAKLDAGQVEEIRRRALAGERLKPLAEEFGVSLPTISQIKNNNAWRKEPEPEADVG